MRPSKILMYSHQTCKRAFYLLFVSVFRTVEIQHWMPILKHFNHHLLEHKNTTRPFWVKMENSASAFRRRCIWWVFCIHINHNLHKQQQHKTEEINKKNKRRNWKEEKEEYDTHYATWEAHHGHKHGVDTQFMKKCFGYVRSWWSWSNSHMDYFLL